MDIRTYQCGPELEPSKFLLKFHVEDDANNISEEERHRCVRTRGLAYDLVMWFFETYEVTDNDTQQPMNLQAWFEPHIAHTAVVMVDYVETYEKHYDTDLIDHEFRYQINLCFQLQQGIYHCIEKMMQSLPSDELNTLAYVGPRNLTITKRSESHYTRTLVAVSPLLRRTDLAYSAPEPYHLLFIGYTAGDKAFLGMPENPNEQTSETESGGVSSAGKERESELESDPNAAEEHENQLDSDPGTDEERESELESDSKEASFQRLSGRERLQQWKQKKRIPHSDSSDSDDPQSDAYRAPGEKRRPPNKKRRM